jgi:PDZ domain-containing protein
MRHFIQASIATSAVVVCALVPRAGSAQATTSSAQPGPFGYLGITNVRCNCTFRTNDDGARNYEFRSNPVVLGVYRNSPADGALERGDTITGINGIPLTTSDGGRRFANIRPGQHVTLNVSRGRAHMTLLFTAARIDGEDERAGVYTPEASDGGWTYDFPAPPALPALPAIPAFPALPATPAVPAVGAIPATPTPGAVVWSSRAPRAGRPAVITSAPGWAPIAPLPPIPPVPAIAPVPPVPPVPALVSPAGWYGFSIRCNECGWSQGRGDDSPVWESSSPPELSMVSRNGPAGRAGLLAGDLLIEIDGLSILTPRGARKFGAVRPGQTVRVTVIRNGKTLTRELTLAEPPETRAVIAAIAPTPRALAAKRELRYTGQLDNVSVEIWSPGGPTVERAGDTMVITVGASVVRLKVKQ